MVIIHLLFVLYDSANRVKSLMLLPFVLAFFYTALNPHLLPPVLLENTMIIQMVLRK